MPQSALLSELTSIRILLERLVLKQGDEPSDSGRLSPHDDHARLAPPSRPATPPWILLVDDEELALGAALPRLMRGGFEVRLVADAAAAVALLGGPAPVAVVLDVASRGLVSGADFVTLVRTNPVWMGVRVVLYTRIAMRRADLCSLHGADLVASKDDPKQLAELLGRVVEHGA